MNELDASEEEEITLASVTGVEAQKSGASLPCSICRTGNGVSLGRSENLNFIATLSCPGIGNGDTSTILTSKSHCVKLGQGRIISLGGIRGIHRDFHGEPTHC